MRKPGPLSADARHARAGDFSCFIFRSKRLATGAEALPTLFRASGENSNFVYVNANKEQLPNGIAFGGNLESTFFGLWLRADMESGRSDAPCS
eukprot:6202180-Pleurochrysis_carterae.AAC.1